MNSKIEQLGFGYHTVEVPNKLIESYLVERYLLRFIEDLETQLDREIDKCDYQTAANCQLVADEVKSILRAVKAIPEVRK